MLEKLNDMRISAFYLTAKSRKQKVRIQETRSSSKEITFDVLQGSILGRYLNDIISSFLKDKVFCSGEDTALIYEQIS